VHIHRLLLVLALLFSGSIAQGQVQKKLSKKERKIQEQEALADRNFIEGTKQLALGEFEKAFVYLQRSLELNPDEPAIHYKIAEIYTRANDAKKALPYAEEAVRLDPENKYYSLMVAEIYNNLNQPLKAAEILDQLTADGESNQQY